MGLGRIYYSFNKTVLIMKKKSLLRLALIAVFSFLFIFSHSQTSSDSIEYNRLYFLCKAWGHAKYYHTKIATGFVHWDDELLTAVAYLKDTDSDTEYNTILENMLINAGDPLLSDVDLPIIPDSLNNNLDLSWISNPIFSGNVSSLLENITETFRPRKNAYVDIAFENGNPVFEEDSLYFTSDQYPSEELRVLALFRYWNIINYFYPYKNIMDQNWDTTLVEFIPKIVQAKNALEYHLSMKELGTRINDTHSFFGSRTFWEWHGVNFPPFLVRFIENEMVVTKVLEDTPVAVGDIIKKIDGYDIVELRDSLRKYISGSNETVIERNLDGYVLGGEEGSFEITLDNGTEIYSQTLERNSTNYNLLLYNGNAAWEKLFNNNSCNVGLVDMDILSTEKVAQMFSELKETNTIIFDIRNYPNGTLWYIVNYLFWRPLHIANFTVPDILYPGRLYWNEVVIGYGSSDPYGGKLIILFDENTQSQAEYTCMGLGQYAFTTKIGSTTAGADGNVSSIYLPGRIAMAASFLGVFYPDYTPTQRIGIIPDIEMRPTILGIRNGIDEVMDEALRVADCSVSVQDEIDNLTLNIFPNPASNVLYFEYSDALNQNLLIDFYDLSGRKLKTINTTQPSGTIDISDLNPGLFILKIKTSKYILVKSILKR